MTLEFFFNNRLSLFSFPLLCLDRNLTLTKQILFLLYWVLKVFHALEVVISCSLCSCRCFWPPERWQFSSNGSCFDWSFWHRCCQSISVGISEWRSQNNGLVTGALFFLLPSSHTLCKMLCSPCLAIKRLLCRLNPKKTLSSRIWLHSFSLTQLAATTKCADLLFFPAHIYKSKLIRVSGHYLWLYSKQEPNAIHGEFACTITKESTWSIAIHFSSETTFHKRAEENDTAIQSIRFGGKLALFMRFGTFFLWWKRSKIRWKW